MKNLVIACAVAVLSLVVATPEAEAKRFGGGRSSGMSRQAAPQQPPKQPAATPQQAPGRQATPGQPSRPGWLGPIAGLAAGLGLAALFSHLGLGEGFASFFMLILLAAAAFFILRMLFRRNTSPQPSATQYAGATPYGSTPPSAAPAPQYPGSSVSADKEANPVLKDFDAESFIRQAKLNFIRLQTANDRGDIEDIRQFTTPEMFAEAKLEITDRGNATQQTDVVDLNAEVVEVTEEAGRYIVSVRFNGLIREESTAAPSQFDEMWHLTKPVDGSDGWRIAGIQQVG